MISEHGPALPGIRLVVGASQTIEKYEILSTKGREYGMQICRRPYLQAGYGFCTCELGRGKKLRLDCTTAQVVLNTDLVNDMQCH